MWTRVGVLLSSAKTHATNEEMTQMMAALKSDREKLSFESLRELGILSDTHGLLERSVLDLFDGVGLILHAGDIGYGRKSKTRETEHSVLGKLRSIAPVIAVRGNVDRDSLLPNVELFDLNNGLVRGLLVHGHEHRIKWSQNDIAKNKAPEILSGDLVRIMQDNRINMLIFGHSHVPGVIFSQGVLYINPGSAGPKRFSLPRTMAHVGFTDGKVVVKIYDIARQCFTKCLKIEEQLLNSKLL